MKMKTSLDGKPKALIARTLKGHGVPGLENAPLSHIINPKPELIDSLLEHKP
jgi:transketolase